MSIHKEVKKVTTHVVQSMKENGEKISMLTSYDYSLAKIVDSGGIDIILVGDSASNVMAGHETTLPITLDQMIYHAQSVVRGVERCLVVVDMPFGSYQGNSKEALNSATDAPFARTMARQSAVSFYLSCGFNRGEIDYGYDFGPHILMNRPLMKAWVFPIE